MNLASNMLTMLLGLLFAFTFWFWSSSVIAADGSTPSGASSPMAMGTPVAQRVFPLPSGKTIVIDAAVNRGALPPEYQAGYEITIDATGHALITVTPQGAYAATPTAKQQVITREVRVAGLQALLNRLERGGYFRLDQLRGGQGMPAGAPGNVISVTLADGKWSMNGPALSPSAEMQLDRMQGWIAEAVGFQPPADLVPSATPAP